MKIFIACSKRFYNRIPQIQFELENQGHEITLPNSYDNPMAEEQFRARGLEEHAQWKASMMRKHRNNVEPNDAILVLNFDKNNQSNYIGGATFLEMYMGWDLGKRLFLYNPIPDSILTDEIIGMQPIILNGDLSKIRCYH